MTMNEIRAILDKAISSTRDKVIKWNATSEYDEYKVNFKRSSLVIWKNEDKGFSSFAFYVINSNGTIIGRLFADELPNGEGTDEDFNKLLQLYTIVYEGVNEITETVQDIMEGLKGNSQPIEGDIDLDEDVPF